MKKDKKPFFLKFWFMWLILSSASFLLPLGSINNYHAYGPKFWWFYFMDLFVPFDYFYVMIGLASDSTFFPILQICILILFLFYVDKLALRFNFNSFVKRILFNLLCLMLLTLLSDLIDKGHWSSMDMFLNGGYRVRP